MLAKLWKVRARFLRSVSILGMRRLLLLAVLLWAGTQSFAHAEEELLLATPVPGQLLSEFAPGPKQWSAGHRGVDLATSPGEEVASAAAGTVSFAGTVAGVGSVSVDHGGIRTTYTPVKASVSKGQRVKAGESLGTVTSGHCQRSCLHWGLTDGQEYFDPMQHLREPETVLLPLGTIPKTAAPLTVSSSAGDAAPRAGKLPVSGNITSPFGQRVHPITGKLKLHDGTDIAAACGTKVQVPWAGQIVVTERHPAYGNRVIVEHPWGRSGYAHLQAIHVQRGEQVESGATLGLVGTTGLSTGCHLHWMTWQGGRLTNPMSHTG